MGVVRLETPKNARKVNVVGDAQRCQTMIAPKVTLIPAGITRNARQA